uniref:Uncharacterized protein n=1 Tax=Glossina pallidipes TaxID=7398 RepID=A0A1B0A424_GLOPL
MADSDSEPFAFQEYELSSTYYFDEMVLVDRVCFYYIYIYVAVVDYRSILKTKTSTANGKMLIRYQDEIILKQASGNIDCHNTIIPIGSVISVMLLKQTTTSAAVDKANLKQFPVAES